jgi:hypothetical protein
MEDDLKQLQFLRQMEDDLNFRGGRFKLPEFGSEEGWKVLRTLHILDLVKLSEWIQ